MGKPIKNRWFGDPFHHSATGREITMEADLGNGEVTAWVISQTSTSEYKLTDGTDVMDCTLVETISGTGEAVLSCYPHSGSEEKVSILTQHRMKTFEGNDYDWKVTTEMNGQSQLTPVAPSCTTPAIIGTFITEAPIQGFEDFDSGDMGSNAVNFDITAEDFSGAACEWLFFAARDTSSGTGDIEIDIDNDHGLDASVEAYSYVSVDPASGIGRQYDYEEVSNALVHQGDIGNIGSGVGDARSSQGHEMVVAIRVSGASPTVGPGFVRIRFNRDF